MAIQLALAESEEPDDQIANNQIPNSQQLDTQVPDARGHKESGWSSNPDDVTVMDSESDQPPYNGLRWRSLFNPFKASRITLNDQLGDELPFLDPVESGSEIEDVQEFQRELKAVQEFQRESVDAVPPVLDDGLAIAIVDEELDASNDLNGLSGPSDLDANNDLNDLGRQGSWHWLQLVGGCMAIMVGAIAIGLTAWRYFDPVLFDRVVVRSTEEFIERVRTDR